jgi:hypothetical protein
MIVKNLMAVGMIAAVATAASAADGGNWKMGGKIRMDAVQTRTEKKVGNADKTTTNASEIMLKRAQFNLTGNRDGDEMAIKYYAESNTLDTATITHKFADNINVAFGKMSVLAQSWENDYSSTDQYLTSMAGNMAPDNSVGGQLNANFGDHNVSLQVVQGISSFSTTSTNATTGKETTTMTTFDKNGGLTSALQYRGEFNKMIRPLATYTMVKTSGTKGSDGGNYGNGYQNQMGLGVQVETSGLVADLEYDSVKQNKLKDNEASKDATYNSMILQAKYAVGMTTPFLKITSDASKLGADNGIGDDTWMNFAIGAEHKLDANCRLHAVYMSKASTVKLTSDTNTKTNVAGFNLGVTAQM